MRIGNYDVIRQIGEGGFGRTFYGTHRLLGEPACLKQEKTGDPGFVRLFREEARLLWRVHHVSLPTLKDYLEHPDHGAVAVMSYIEGESLHDAVEARGPIDDEHACWILQRVLDALSYLHHHGIVHCDVKPQNIILDVDAHNATLVDFGLCVERPDGAARAKGGTRFFMPPEFGRGLPPIPACDIYSLGMTAAAMTGGDVRNGTLPADMDPRLAAVIGGMIRRDPTARPQDARELNHELAETRRRVFGRSATRERFKLRGEKP